MQEESTTVAIAERVLEALDDADLSAITELLDPAVRWGAPDDMEGGCQNRKQVLDWYRRGREAGARAQVTEVVAADDRILVALKVTGTPAAEEPGGEAERWQVLTVARGRIVDIRAFDDRADAASRVGLPT
jgi:ketosteroid isomerase-like protein